MKIFIEICKFQLRMLAFVIIPNVLIICFAMLPVTYLPDNICMKAIYL